MENKNTTTILTNTDYYILKKPIYIYAYDYDEYNTRRGLYFDMKNIFKSKFVSNYDLKKLYDQDELRLQVNSRISEGKYINHMDVNEILEYVSEKISLG